MKLRPENWLAGLALVVADPFIEWELFFYIVTLFIVCLAYLLHESIDWWIELSRKEVHPWPYIHNARSTARPYLFLPPMTGAINGEM